MNLINIIKNNNMITTVDGVKTKRGDVVWEIGITLKGVYKPTRSVVHSINNPVSNEEQCYHDFSLCQIECEKRNLNKPVDVIQEDFCPRCKSIDLLDIDDNYTKCFKCGFSFVA